MFCSLLQPDVPALSQDSAPAENFEVPESEAACAPNSVKTMGDDVATPAIRSSARSNIGT